MRALEDQPPEGPDRPPVEFWENTLEFPVTSLLEDANSPVFRNDWIGRRGARQIAMLRHLLGLRVDAPPRERKAELKDRHDELIKFVPASHFAIRKSRDATLDVAVDCLDEAIIALARERDGSYDHAALIFGILDRSWPDLEKVFHLDKLHKVGFERMRLPRPPRRPAQRFKDFLAGDEILEVLRRFDADQHDRHGSQFQKVIEVRDAQVVFIRRPHQESYVLAGNEVIHGFSSDQIVLDFRDEAARLNVASHDHAASYEIANRVASAFYRQPCEYEDVTEEAFAAQISRFLRTLRDDQARDLRLVEIRLQGSPLDGAPDMDLSTAAIFRSDRRSPSWSGHWSGRSTTSTAFPASRCCSTRSESRWRSSHSEGWTRTGSMCSGTVTNRSRSGSGRCLKPSLSRIMGSRSSRRRSAAHAAADRALLSSLLQHGALFPTPDAEVLEAAGKLVELRLVDLQQLRTVCCAHSTDGDFPPPTPNCDGLIHLRPDADEGGGQYRCPRCERIVYPEADRKEVFDGLLVCHRQTGIEAFLIGRCGELAMGRTFSDGVLAVSVQGINAAVCLVDYCRDARWLGRGFVVNQRCIYVTVGRDTAPRMLREDAVACVEFVDILLGLKDLPTLITQRATTPPAVLANLDPFVYSLGARPIAPESRERDEPRRVFHLCLSAEGLLVDGLLSIRAGRTVAMAIMGIFMQRFMDAAMSGDPVEPITAKDLANALDPHAERFEDADSIARHIPRMRESIIDTVRQNTGKPIGEHDIIETVSRSGANADADGYRLNPRSVALGPLEL